MSKVQTRDIDVTVVGGGLAGVCAAVAAARQGMRVALINNRPVLGGNSSSEIRVWVCGAPAHGMQRWARENGIIGEMLLENQYRNPDGNPIYWDDVVLDTVRAEPNIELFLNTDVREVVASGPPEARVIESVTGWTLGAETTTQFRSPMFLDCTGDGLVGYLAGANYRVGRESREELGEEWAPVEADRQLLGSTLLFYTKDVGHPVKYVAPASAKDITTTPIPTSRVINSGDNGAHYWWIEWGGELDIVHDNERIRDELRSVILGVWDYIKNSGKFRADNLSLEWIGNLPGKREYRRFVGDYTLTQMDILEQREFADAVGYGGWAIDLHPVEGMYAANAGAVQRNAPGIYQIPYRCLYSANVANMLMAGRNVSVSHVAFGSTRVMATCSTMGEAIGVAASLAVRHQVSPREVGTHHLDELLQSLLRADAPVLGVCNTDPDDLARRASVRASSVRDRVQAEAPAVRDLPLTRDVGVVVPVNPRLDGVSVHMRALQDVTVQAEVWSTGKLQNAVPMHREATASTGVRAGHDGPVTFPLQWDPATACNAVIVLRSADGISMPLTNDVPPGVLALLHGAPVVDQNVDISADDVLVSWPAAPLRGVVPVFQLGGVSQAYGPHLATGGYQRHYGGPNMWCSAAFEVDPQPSLTLNWDEEVAISEIDLVFDDESDTELNTLHHHRTEWAVPASLVRDFHIEVRATGGSWVRVAQAEANRRRHVRVPLEHAYQASELRVVVTATHGACDARIVSLRVYE